MPDATPMQPRRVDPAELRQIVRTAAAELAAMAERLEFVNSGDPTAPIVESHAQALAAAYSGAMTPFREAILASSSPEDAVARVSRIYRDWSPIRVIEAVNEALQLAAAAGAARAVHGR